MNDSNTTLEISASENATTRTVVDTNIYVLPGDHWLRIERGCTHVTHVQDPNPFLGEFFILYTESETSIESEIDQLRDGDQLLRMNLNGLTQATVGDLAKWPNDLLQQALIMKGKELRVARISAQAKRVAAALPVVSNADYLADDLPAGMKVSMLTEIWYQPTAPETWLGHTCEYWRKGTLDTRHDHRNPLFLRQNDVHSGKGGDIRHANSHFGCIGRGITVPVTATQLQHLERLIAQDKSLGCPPASAHMAILAILLDSETEGFVNLSTPNIIHLDKDKLQVSLSEDDDEAYDVAVVDDKGRKWAEFHNLALENMVSYALLAIDQAAARQAIAQEQAEQIEQTEAASANTGR